MIHHEEEREIIHFLKIYIGYIQKCKLEQQVACFTPSEVVSLCMEIIAF